MTCISDVINSESFGTAELQVRIQLPPMIRRICDPGVELNPTSKANYPPSIEIWIGEDLPLSDLRNIWFQNDGAHTHKVSSVQQYIRDTFQQQVIGYGGCVEWPPHSPDLNPLDFCRWRYVKQRVYTTPPPTLQELRNRITDACASVAPAMLYNVQREVQSRVQMCIVAEGHHFEHDR
ncbi:hypothetical protein AVEN_269690-1 [Araneus ventricosus]|uniref:Tc1-like transposase DDE domain-containing protein n=1 Tax=Araneus ventricosus TaxID=182803 RepID=A0A4Y2SCC5_ARAVE|nr:hypothetical protein AVEN_269690-1 [Araneus ventricosus]